MKLLTYQDVSGRRRLRRYVTAAMAILCLLFVFSWAGLRQGRQEAPAQATAASLMDTAARLLPDRPTDSDPLPVVEAAQGCPSQLVDWSFLEIFPGDHYRRIEPACVYAGVARTAAWMLAERMGYSKPEASRLLGFAAIPEHYRTQTPAYANFRGPSNRELLAEWPPHPDFFFWQVDRDGRSAVTISLRGCYRLETEAHCVLAMDRAPGTAVSVLGAYGFGSPGAHLPAVRTFFLLVYRGSGEWNLTGQFADSSIYMDDLSVLVSEREQVTARLGVEPWDADWLFAHFDIAMKPLPDGWRLMSLDPVAMDRVAYELNQYGIAVDGSNDE